jgi:3-hydroxybutyryl-CoA dehydrogenase
MKITNVGILGAGTLGSRVALQASLSGYVVSILDISPEALATSRSVMSKIVHQLSKSSGIDLRSGNEAIESIRFTTDLKSAVSDADLINESVTEDLQLKREIWKKVGELTPSKTILTTNTSYLLPSQFAQDTGRPERFCALHFHDVFYAKVVDIMPHPGTDFSLVPVLMDFGRSLGQVPVLIKKENPGYLFNSMLMSFIGAAGKLLTKEIGSIEDIDRSWMVNFHMPMGPFGILDSIGLDTAWHVVHVMPDKASQAFAQLLHSYIEKGHLGEKTGKGFYTYPQPAYRQPDFFHKDDYDFE